MEMGTISTFIIIFNPAGITMTMLLPHRDTCRLDILIHSQARLCRSLWCSSV